MTDQTVTCPNCGLVVTLRQGKGGTRLSYDPGEWQRLCQYPELDSPALCFLEDHSSPGAPKVTH